VEFEDGQYTVNCVGANHNISDVKVANQVSLIVNNAAGLITNSAIEFASFNGGVTIDKDNLTGKAVSGTLFPTGTDQAPVDNLADALLIAEVRGFRTFYVMGDLAIEAGEDVSDYSFVGESMARTLLTLDADATVEDCEFYESSVEGTLDGECKIKNCQINNVTYISGFIELCVLSGTIILGGGAAAYFMDCWAGSLLGAPPVIDLGGTGQTLVMQNFNGYIKWRNLTGLADQANVSLNAGWVVLESTMTGGYVNIIGVGTVEDYSNGTVVNLEHLVNPHNIRDHVWSDSRAQLLYNMESGRWKIDANTNQMIFYKADNITEVARFNLFDSAGAPASENVFERRRVTTTSTTTTTSTSTTSTTTS
jgi:hypothetical protein